MNKENLKKFSIEICQMLKHYTVEDSVRSIGCVLVNIYMNLLEENMDFDDFIDDFIFYVRQFKKNIEAKQDISIIEIPDEKVTH